MTIYFYKEDKVMIRMGNYVDDILEDTRNYMDRESTSPSADHLFTVNENTELLSEGERHKLHTMKAKLQFLYKRARPDLQ